MKNFQTSMDILREDAREEGRREAREKIRERLVSEMIRRGVDVDTIQEISQLDPQRVLELHSKFIL